MKIIMDIAKRSNKNPLIRPADLKPGIEGMEITCLLNPGVFQMNGKIWLLLRVAERPKQEEGKISFPIYDEEGKIRILKFDKDDPLLDLSDPRVIMYKGKNYLTTLSYFGLSFDEVAGVELTAEGKGLKAVLKRAPAELFGDGKPMPTFPQGKKGKAIHFSEGSHLEISTFSRSDFEGKTMSIAVWVKPDKTKSGNYIISYNDWHSWKFQLQENNKPFFTVFTSKGCTDADNESDFSAPNGEWTHLVVVLDLTNENLTFHVNGGDDNGGNTKIWDKSKKEFLTGTIVPNEISPLVIGAFNSYQAAMIDWEGWDAENWNNYFEGAMDELKVYNIALTQGQVSKLYNSEK